jgi:transposase
MLRVDDYLQIRLLHRDGLSIRQIARQLGHSRKSVNKALQDGLPRGYTRAAPPASPKLGSFHGVIGEILQSDLTEPPKQRHTAFRIFERLRDERGYTGGYDQVRRYVQKHRRREQETFVHLAVAPGERLECDFGHIQVDFPDGRREVPVLLAVWSYSHYPFLIALPNERWESILLGMVCAFEFFGVVPRELWWDNPRTVAQRVLRGRDRQINPHYLQLASHYCFAPKFCMPAKGQEKSDVERSVFSLQRRFATPVPRVANMDELNRHLLGCCLKERQRTVRGREMTIGRMFQQEVAAAAPLPCRPFDPCVIHQRQADKYQCVTFEDVHYSVPRQAAFSPVTLKAYLDQVVLVREGEVIARHRRSRQAAEHVLDPLHFLQVLERKPAYLEKTRLFNELKLPPAFTELRRQLEGQWGEREGKRQYIQTLQLLGSYDQQRLTMAGEASLGARQLRAGAIRLRLEGEGGGSGEVNHRVRVEVPPPDLGRFNQLLSGPHNTKEMIDVANDDVTTGTEPQDAQAADGAAGVCPSIAGSLFGQQQL